MKSNFPDTTCFASLLTGYFVLTEISQCTNLSTQLTGYITIIKAKYISFRIFWSELFNDLRFKEYFYKWVALRVLPMYFYDIFHQFFCFSVFSVFFSTVGWWYKDTINGLIVITMCKDHWEYNVTSVTRGTCLVTQPNELTEQQSKVTSFIQNFLVTEYQMLLSFIFAFYTILNNKYHFKLKIVS